MPGSPSDEADPGGTVLLRGCDKPQIGDIARHYTDRTETHSERGVCGHDIRRAFGVAEAPLRSMDEVLPHRPHITTASHEECSSSSSVSVKTVSYSVACLYSPHNALPPCALSDGAVPEEPTRGRGDGRARRAKRAHTAHVRHASSTLLDHLSTSKSSQSESQECNVTLYAVARPPWIDVPDTVRRVAARPADAAPFVYALHYALCLATEPEHVVGGGDNDVSHTVTTSLIEVPVGTPWTASLPPTHPPSVTPHGAGASHVPARSSLSAARQSSLSLNLTSSSLATTLHGPASLLSPAPERALAQHTPALTFASGPSIGLADSQLVPCDALDASLRYRSIPESIDAASRTRRGHVEADLVDDPRGGLLHVCNSSITTAADWAYSVHDQPTPCVNDLLPLWTFSQPAALGDWARDFTSTLPHALSGQLAASNTSGSLSGTSAGAAVWSSTAVSSGIFSASSGSAATLASRAEVAATLGVSERAAVLAALLSPALVPYPPCYAGCGSAVGRDVVLLLRLEALARRELELMAAWTLLWRRRWLSLQLSQRVAYGGLTAYAQVSPPPQRGRTTPAIRVAWTQLREEKLFLLRRYMHEVQRIYLDLFVTTFRHGVFELSRAHHAAMAAEYAARIQCSTTSTRPPATSELPPPALLNPVKAARPATSEQSHSSAMALSHTCAATPQSPHSALTTTTNAVAPAEEGTTTGQPAVTSPESYYTPLPMPDVTSAPTSVTTTGSEDTAHGVVVGHTRGQHAWRGRARPDRAPSLGVVHRAVPAHGASSLGPGAAVAASCDTPCYITSETTNHALGSTSEAETEGVAQATAGHVHLSRLAARHVAGADSSVAFHDALAFVHAAIADLCAHGRRQQRGHASASAAGEDGSYVEHEYDNGDVYTGHWGHNTRHGTGVYRFAVGRLLYVGGWADGVPHGEGILLRSRGGGAGEAPSWGAEEVPCIAFLQWESGIVADVRAVFVDAAP